MISKIVTTWWFSFLRLLIASTISSWMCLAHLSSYFLSSASSLKKKKSCLSLISPPLTPLNLSHYCLVILYAIILSLALFVLPPPLPRPQDGPLILVHGFSLVKLGKVLDSPVGHTLHILFIFILIFSLSSISQRVSSLSWHFSNDGRASSCWFHYTVFRLVSIWCPHWFFSWSIFLSCPDCLVYGSVVAHW